jgi:hypothetical protein
MLDQKSFPNRPFYCGHLIPWTLGADARARFGLWAQSPGLWARPVSYPLDSGRGRKSQIWTLGAIPWTLGAAYAYPLDSGRNIQNLNSKNLKLLLRPESNIPIRASL